MCGICLLPIIIDLFQLNEGVNMFQRQFVSELRRCEEMERQLSKCLHGFLVLRSHIHLQVY